MRHNRRPRRDAPDMTTLGDLAFYVMAGIALATMLAIGILLALDETALLMAGG